VLPQFVKVDFNAFYGRSADAAHRQTEYLCAYAFTQIDVGQAQHAILEVGAGQQPVQGWLNGQPLSERPMTVAPTPVRWPVDLRAGANELLMKVCKTTGDWYFTARVTDTDGRDLPGIAVRAALPQPAVTAQPTSPVQLIDGFGAPGAASRQSELYSDYRGDSPAWWEALEDPNGAVVWNTAPVPTRAPTAFVFTGTMSEPPGQAELWVNRQYALTFPTGRFETPQRWQRGPYVLEFVPREQGDFLSGYFRLQVPAEQITAGQPVELRVAHIGGSPFSFFQIKGRHDTAQFEHLTLDGRGVETQSQTTSGSGTGQATPLANGPTPGAPPA
jgi:hypothetical protein